MHQSVKRYNDVNLAKPIPLPSFAQVIKLDVDAEDKFYILALSPNYTTPEGNTSPRKMWAYQTGEDIPREATYVNSFVSKNGAEWHAFIFPLV